MSSPGVQSQLQELQDAAQHVIRALGRAHDEVAGVKDATKATALEVEELLGGTSTEADQAMIDFLGEAHREADFAARSMREAMFSLSKALAHL